MKIHPITILLILLGAGRLFGVSGVILGVPGYAIIKVIFSELYGLYRERSGIYDDEEIPLPLQGELTDLDEVEEPLEEDGNELNQRTD